jgi:hypothetical protein
VDRLVTTNDLRPVDVADVVRLALVVHGRPSLVARVLDGATVGLVLPTPATTSAKARLQAAINRLGAELLVVEPRGRGLPPPIDDVVGQLRLADVRVCVVAGPSTGAIQQLSEHLAAPTFNASQRPDDPWPVLAGTVAERLCAAHDERGAVDGYEEMVREAMVPTAAAVIALLAGAAVPTRTAPTIDLRTETASHWFG